MLPDDLKERLESAEWPRKRSKQTGVEAQQTTTRTAQQQPPQPAPQMASAPPKQTPTRQPTVVDDDDDDADDDEEESDDIVTSGEDTDDDHRDDYGERESPPPLRRQTSASKPARVGVTRGTTNSTSGGTNRQGAFEPKALPDMDANRKGRVQQSIDIRKGKRMDSLRTRRRENKPNKADQLGGGSLDVGLGDLKQSLRRAQQAWNDQLQAKREPKSPWGLWKTRPMFTMSKTSEFSLAIKDYSRKLLQVILQARRDKHLGLDAAFWAQHGKLVGYYVGNSQLPKSQASSFRAMRSVIVEFPKGSCMFDYIATTDKATYGHMVADDVELLLHQPTKVESQGRNARRNASKPVKRGRNEVPSLVLARPLKQRFGGNPRGAKPLLTKASNNNSKKQVDVDSLYAMSKALNAPVVVSHRKVDDDDFDASNDAEFVLNAVLPTLFGTRLTKPSHTVLLGGATKGTLMFTNQDAPKLSWPANPPIWVDSSQVAPEMFVLFCSKRGVLPIGPFINPKGVAAQVGSLELLLERMPTWFFTNLLEYTSMAQVELSVLAELVTIQSLLHEFQESDLNTALLTDKAGMLAQLGQHNVLSNLANQLGPSNDWQQRSDYFDVAHVANMLEQAKHLYS